MELSDEEHDYASDDDHFISTQEITRCNFQVISPLNTPTVMYGESFKTVGGRVIASYANGSTVRDFVVLLKIEFVAMYKGQTEILTPIDTSELVHEIPMAAIPDTRRLTKYCDIVASKWACDTFRTHFKGLYSGLTLHDIDAQDVPDYDQYKLDHIDFFDTKLNKWCYFSNNYVNYVITNGQY